MYVAILSAMRRADRVFPHHLSCAISADCVHAIIHIYPNEDLLEEAACVIDRMVNSRDANLKYLGLNCLADMIQLYPQYVIRLQMVVLKSLDNDDITIRNSVLNIHFLYNLNRLFKFFIKCVIHKILILLLIVS